MKKTALIAILIIYTVNALFAKTIEGKWDGVLEVKGNHLNVVFIIKSKDGKYFATMDSPDQGATGIVVDSVKYLNNNVELMLLKNNIVYKGIVNKTKDKIEGKFSQNGMEFPLLMKRVEMEQKLVSRPQTPVGPFPYYWEEVSFVNQIDNVTLSGTLILPKKKGNFPVVIMITGSGPQDRDETIYGHKPFWVIADYLAKKGIAVLRYDDRGTGKSSGDFKTATSANFSLDARAAIGYLQRRPDINKKQIGIIGHSEGGMIAPMVASITKDVAFIVLMAAPGIPNEELMILQTARAATLSGVEPALIKINTELEKGIYSIIKNDKSQFPEARLTTYLEDKFAGLPNEMKPSTEKEVKQIIQNQVKEVTSPWFQYFIKYNNANALCKVSCPVLAINGSLDCQVTPKENLAGIEEALKKGNNNSYKVIELPGLNHLFQEAKTGATDEYAKIDQTISPKALEIMGDWIVDMVKK